MAQINEPNLTALLPADRELVLCDGEEAWLAERRKGIGSSDIGAILGLSPWKSALSVYSEKYSDPATGEPMVPPRKATEGMRWGSRLEAVIRAHYAKENEVEVWHRKHSLIKAKHFPFLASLDGAVVRKDSLLLLECKTAFKDADWGEQGTDDIPPAYIAQVQWAMNVLGLKCQHADIAVLFSGNNYRSYTVERDDELIDIMLSKALEFMVHIETGEPPPPDDGSKDTAQALASIYTQKNTSIIIEGDLEARNAIDDLEVLNIEIAEREAERDKIKNLLRSKIGTEMGIEGGEGRPWYSWKTTITNRMDTGAFKGKHPDLYHEFLKQTSSRRFLRHNQKGK